MTSRIGIMQGRLSRPLNGRIQSFPINTWEKEFYLAKEIGYSLVKFLNDYYSINQENLASISLDKVSMV